MRLALLIVPLATLVPADAFLIWALGFAQRPHHAGYAFIVGAIAAVVLPTPLLFVYRLRIKQIRKL